MKTEIGLEPDLDEAGNAWAYLPGSREPALAVGSHVDSVPNGGWLDGALGVMGALGVLRAWVRGGRLEARLATSAVAALGDLLTETPDGRPALRAAGRTVEIPPREPRAR